MGSILNWEKVMLGTVITDQKSWVEVADIQPKDLDSQQHRTVWVVTLKGHKSYGELL